MVDLHQVEPGLPDGHPWKTFSRWQTAWRSFLGISFVGMIGTLFLAVVTAGNWPLNILESFLPLVFAVILPLVGAVLASVFGQWLKRYYPFSQSLLFAGITVVTMTVVSAVLSVWVSIARGPCPADTICSAPFDGTFWVIAILGLPVFLSSCIGYGLSIWLPTKRGAKVFWPLWCGAFVVFGIVLLVANF